MKCQILFSGGKNNLPRELSINLVMQYIIILITLINNFQNKTPA